MLTLKNKMKNYLLLWIENCIMNNLEKSWGWKTLKPLLKIYWKNDLKRACWMKKTILMTLMTNQEIIIKEGNLITREGQLLKLSLRNVLSKENQLMLQIDNQIDFSKLNLWILISELKISKNQESIQNNLSKSSLYL